MKVITREREARGWSRTELGRLAHIHPARVGQAENGWVIPYPAERLRLAQALGFHGDPLELFSEAEETAAPECHCGKHDGEEST